MNENIDAQVRWDNLTLLSIFFIGIIGGLAVIWTVNLVFVGLDGAMALIRNLEVHDLGRAEVVLPLLVAIAALSVSLYSNTTSGGSNAAKVWTEEGRLVVKSTTVFQENTLRLSVESVERTETGLVVTGSADTWWNWGRYIVRVESKDTEALETRLEELEQG